MSECVFYRKIVVVFLCVGVASVWKCFAGNHSIVQGGFRLLQLV